MPARAQELSGADFALIALPEDQQVDSADVTELVIAVSVGLDSSALTKTDPSGRVDDGRGVHRSPAEECAGSWRSIWLTNFGPALALPLGAGEAISGVLLTVRLPGSAVFDELELQLVSTFADQAALALQRAEDQVTQRELEVLEDRDRIARDLHDHVIQRLFAVGLAMQSTHRREKSPRQAMRLAEHIDQLHDVIQEIRTSIFDLQADPAHTKSLRNLLQEVITELTEESGIRTTVRMGGPVNALPAVLAQHARQCPGSGERRSPAFGRD